MIVAAMVALFALETALPAFAGTSGIISGTVTDAQTHAPLANVKVSASAPSGSYTASTDSHGFYSITGVYTDTYVVSFALSGYDATAVPGVSVFADLTATVNAAMAHSMKTIARVVSRGTAGAFQPRQTTDTYSVSTQQIGSINGNALNTSESNLIVSLPGGSLDSSGYPVIRGGRENEENFEFEGIPYTDAFTNQFTNTLAAPGMGLQSIQLTPGLGDASQDNYGTGTFNLIARRGTSPGFATLQASVGGPAFRHQLNFEYGTASQDGRFSNYSAFAGQDRSSAYHSIDANANSIGTFFSRRFQTDREFINNFVYRFGNNKNQSLQFFTDLATHQFFNGNGGLSQFCFRSCDPLFDSFAATYNSLPSSGFPACGTSGSYNSAMPTATCPQGGGAYGLIANLMTLDRYQTSPYQTMGTRALGGSIQPNQAFKLAYNWNLNPSTVLQAMWYHTNAVTIFDQPLRSGYSSSTSSYISQQGGQTTGGKVDLTKNLSDKHLLKAGMQYRFLHPVFDSPPGNYGILMLSPFLGGGYGSNSEFLDFATPAQCQQFLGYSTATATSKCGYIYRFGAASPPAGTKIPAAYESTSINRQDWTWYVNDEWAPNSRLRVNYGLRVEEANYRYPAAAMNMFTCTSQYYPNYVRDGSGNIVYVPSTNPNAQGYDPVTGVAGPKGMCPKATFALSNAEKRPIIPEPVIAASLRLGPNDSIRASYGRSVEFPLLSDVDLTSDPAFYSAFAGIPAHTGALCGVLNDQQCVTYSDELHWHAQNVWAGNPTLTPVRPTWFTNVDFSWSHQFTNGALNGVGFKVTPFYRKAHDEIALIRNPLFVNGVLQTDPVTGNPLFGPSVATNKGANQVTGVEMQITKESAYGLSGQVSMTYQNEFSSVIPLSGSEDFFPSIPASSLALNNQYRVGFLSPFVASVDLSYHTHSGWRINPQYQYNVGYPNSPGLLATAYINGTAYNVPNTNVSAGLTGAPFGTPAYVDPLNPGSFFAPNIAATRGIPANSSPGGVLSHPNSITNLTIEKEVSQRTTLGFSVFNLFDNEWSGASYNSRYQPLANGISGPLSGQISTQYTLGPLYGFAPYGLNRSGNQPYIDTQNGIRSYYVYATVKL